MLTSGGRLGSYEIVSSLGAGGMGEVYRARDTKLGRDVAIKILPELFVGDPDRIARFQREAQLLAALNHPNIAAIYGLEDAGSTHFIVMELVDGESLDHKLRPGRLPLGEALAIARQIVDALEAAHDKGIVHRDLKPANIMLTVDGQVKVLDFGLAKHDASGSSVSSERAGLTHSPTLTFAATQAGMILGTAAYMSPEQARGRPADKRSDVWAFGCVLYEMLAGKRAFEGDDATDIIAAVVRAEPDWDALPRDVTPPIRTLIKRCLEKDRKARIPDMSVVRFLMADAERASSIAATRVPTTVPARRSAAIAIAGAVAGAAIAGVVMRTVMRPQPASPRRTARFIVAPPGAQPLNIGGPDRSVVIDRAGGHVATINGADPASGGQLMVRDLSQLEPVALRGVAIARSPFFSPDGRWIGYFDTGDLKKVPVGGGPPITICRISGGTRGSDWGADNTIIFATNALDSGLFSVPAAGGEPKLLTKADVARGEVDHLYPSILPGGRAVLFTVVMNGPIDNSEIAVLDLKTGQRKTLIRGGAHAMYFSPTGSEREEYVFYASAGTLRAVRFDRERLEVLGEPAVVVDQVRTEATGAAQFSLSPNGTLVYVPGGVGAAENRMLVWVDRRGREQPIDAPPRLYQIPRVASDGAHIAVMINDPEQDIWVLDPPRQPLTRLTFGPSGESNPVWMPDMRRILFSSTRSGIPNVFWQKADGTGTPDQLTTSDAMAIPFSVAPDGRKAVVGITGGTDIAVLTLDEPRQLRPLIVAQGIQANAEISPDGRWLAYQSGESGQNEIYVRPFPNVDAGRWQISTGGGVKPAWARNGRELFYLAPDFWMMAVPVRISETFSFAAPVKLFHEPYFEGVTGRSYDVSPDGTKFLAIKSTVSNRAAATASVVVVLDWLDELRQRMSAK
jgi:Tol biopolymer transport system component